eukprot:2320269-Rhodomonas_salina.3
MITYDRPVKYRASQPDSLCQCRTSHVIDCVSSGNHNVFAFAGDGNHKGSTISVPDIALID